MELEIELDLELELELKQELKLEEETSRKQDLTQQAINQSQKKKIKTTNFETTCKDCDATSSSSDKKK